MRMPYGYNHVVEKVPPNVPPGCQTPWRYWQQSVKLADPSEVDSHDWQILPPLFYKYNEQCGPYTVDAASDTQA